MNKAYRVIWNAVTGTWTAVSEHARSHRKGASRTTRAASIALCAAVSAIAFSGSAYAAGNSAVEIGDNASATADGSVAIGENATVDAAATNSVALGAGSLADRAQSVSVGSVGNERQITNVAAGTEATDAVNFGQQTNTAQSVATALGGGASVAPNGAILSPTYTLGGTDYHSVGDALSGLDTRVTSVENISATGSPYLAVRSPTGPASATGQYALSVGMSTRSTGTGSVAVGSNASALSNGAIAIGQNARATANNGSAFGYQAVASGDNATAFGTNSSVTATNAVGLGNNATAAANNSVSLGSRAKVAAGANNSMALGQGATVNAAATNSVALGAGSGVSRANTVSVGATGSERQIANMAAGTASTDAVNVSQLQGVTNALGGGASIDPATGALIAPSYTIQGNAPVNNVGDALSLVDGALTQNASDITTVSNNLTQLGDTVTTIGDHVTQLDGRVTTNETNITNLQQQISNGTVGLVQQAGAGADLTVGAGTNGARVNFADQNGNARALANVANGVADSDAVNVAQLKAAQGQIGDLDQLAAKYDDASQASITLGGANGTQIHNVADGTADTDAVNVSQLKNLQAQLGDVGTQLGGAVMYDRLADGSVNLGSVTLGGAGSAAVTLTNVANGAINASSTDAVNGSQLYALQTQVDDISGRIGPGTAPPGNGSGYFDGTDVSKDAAATTPVYAGNGAGNTAGGSNASIADGVNGATALGANASVTAENAVALGAGSMADRANSVSVGAAGSERQITNVAAGTAPTDAANVQQVNDALKSANSYTDSSVGALSSSMNQRFDDANRAINQVAKNAYAGIAAAMAMPNMTPSGPGKTIVAAGGATYKGGSAVAAGATYRSRNGNWLVNGAVSVTSIGDAGVRAQVGYEF
ncbi:ESPR-type extended signal peptide-containing protein [Burkholderia sp. Ac-20392]|uniref:ESPR-type extended signal peptide-containing protein n=1 Tax=Burkholderia sp. Ac-20392 TaxID=2703905 RepID=UPI00197DA856|nr:ESPR-type extended signal peptide-containing protein [Burkholderia sp. Ac-20392]MBN3796171.1 hypothetical protein [Burkholderia sp. Ac-20392]